MEQTSKGVFCAFVPDTDVLEDVDSYLVYIINHTQHELLFSAGIHLEGVLKENLKGRIKVDDLEKLGRLYRDSLNDSPSIQFQFWPVSAIDGKVNQFEFKLKIKVKGFLNKWKEIPLLGESAYVYEIFKEFPNLNTSDLDRSHFVSLEKRAKKKMQPVSRLEMKASMSDEIDLHIEKLLSDYSKMSNGEIVQVQLRHAMDFLDHSLKFGLDRIYLIHGGGKGRLKLEINTLLDEHPHVKSYKNEYHPKYGHGATQVDLG